MSERKKTADPKKKMPRSFRFDGETQDALRRLREAYRDPLTGRARSESDVLRILIRQAVETAEK